MADEAAADRPAETRPTSPCVGICLMDPRTRMCRGCLRTVEEITLWYTATPSEQHAILAQLAARRNAAGGR